jgi:hypothetical protein
VQALQYPLLRGTVLQFDGGGMAAVVQVTLSAVAPTGSTSLSVTPLSADVSATSFANDSGVNVATAQRLVKGCQYGTSQVKLYCASRYDDNQLVQCWSVNRWATIAAAKWVCQRRSQACPIGLKEDWEEALEEMKQVKVGMLQLEDVGTRTSAWPFISNVTINIGYDFTRARVEMPLSELTPTQYPQHVDWNSLLWVEV